MTVLAETDWRALARAHETRADALTSQYRARKAARQTHPVEDFLFTYYPVKPAQLRRWHPGPGVVLEHADHERASWRWYRAVTTPDRRTGAAVDNVALFDARGESIAFITELLRRTNDRTPHFGCFGLHEWAMVYRLDPSEIRHSDAPLRLGSAGTDRVVKSHRIRCTHFDAFRFFTEPAVPLNELQPSRERTLELEQPGCLHAGMDCYRWATKLGPLIPGELMLDCFELARDIRELDMRASPYDLSSWGYRAVPIETTEGKSEYVAAQREFTERGSSLRARLLAVVSAAEPVPSPMQRVVKQ